MPSTTSWARVETQTSAALVRYTAQEVTTVLEQLRAKPLTLLLGYDLRIVDGNHREGTEHRLGVLRDQGGGPAWRGRCRPQPAKPPDRGRGAQRRRPRSGMRSVCLPFAEIACASVVARRPPLLYQRFILFGIARRRAFFLIRQHAGHLRWRLVGTRRYCGRSDTGEVYEQAVILTDPETGEEMTVRRITVELDKPTRDGEGSASAEQRPGGGRHHSGRGGGNGTDACETIPGTLVTGDRIQDFDGPFTLRAEYPGLPASGGCSRFAWQSPATTWWEQC